MPTCVDGHGRIYVAVRTVHADITLSRTICSAPGEVQFSFMQHGIVSRDDGAISSFVSARLG